MARKNFNLDKLVKQTEDTLVPTHFEKQTTTADQPNKVGRPVSKRNCSRGVGKSQTFFLSPEDKQRLADCAYFAHVDQQDIIRLALKNFLDLHTRDGRLTDSAIQDILQYVEQTTIG